MFMNIIEFMKSQNLRKKMTYYLNFMSYCYVNKLLEQDENVLYGGSFHFYTPTFKKKRFGIVVVTSKHIIFYHDDKYTNYLYVVRDIRDITTTKKGNCRNHINKMFKWYL